MNVIEHNALCLREYLEEFGGPGEVLFEAGCGYGIFALEALRAGFQRAVVVDKDRYCCMGLFHRALAEGMGDRILVIQRRIEPGNGIGSLDSLVHMASAVQGVDLVKIDLQPSTAEILEWTPDIWVCRVKAVHVDLADSPQDAERVQTFMETRGLKPYGVTGGWRR